MNTHFTVLELRNNIIPYIFPGNIQGNHLKSKFTILEQVVPWVP